MNNQAPILTSFVCGVFVAAGLCVYGQAKATAKESAWSVASVDTAAIRADFNAKMKLSWQNDEDAMHVIQLEPQFHGAKREDLYAELMKRRKQEVLNRDDETSAEVNQETKSLLGEGYEPFAASIVRDIYNNEKVWFFRKKNQ